MKPRPRPLDVGDIRFEMERSIARVCRYGSQRRDDVVRWTCRRFLAFYEALLDVIEDEAPDPTGNRAGGGGKR